MKRLAAWVFVSAAMFGQRSAFDAFEVATIHPTPLDWRDGRFIRMETAHQLVARKHTFKTLLAAAFNLSPKAIFDGPPWLDSASSTSVPGHLATRAQPQRTADDVAHFADRTVLV